MEPYRVLFLSVEFMFISRILVSIYILVASFLGAYSFEKLYNGIRTYYSK